MAKEGLFAGKEFSGKYLLEEEIATSPLFYVYRAKHKFLEKPVAVKIFRVDIIKSPHDIPILKEIASEVIEEIRRLGALEPHPNINWITDVDKEMGGKVLYFVMDYAPEDLQDVVSRRGHLELSRAFKLTENILRALDYTHSHGITHKNLKPSNVRFKENTLVLTDFGLGYIAQKAIRRLKLSGFLEPPIYVSPRILKGEDYVSFVEADLYSVAGLLYFMVTGHEPYEGDFAKIHADKLAGRIVPPSQHNPEIPEDVEKFILKGLEILDGKGFESAEEMLEALYEAFKTVYAYKPHTLMEIRDEEKKIQREIFVKENSDVNLMEVHAPSIINSSSPGSIVFKFDRGQELEFDVNINPDSSYEIINSQSRKTYSIIIRTEPGYYGVLEVNVQIRLPDGSTYFREPLNIPILVMPVQGQTSGVEF